MVSGFWSQPVTIERNNFKHKSMCAFSCNTAVGCSHGCRFCYVPEVSTNKMLGLAKLGVHDPDADWGRYVFPRKWDEKEFRRSLLRAENIPVKSLPADGHRAVMLSTTTDPYQVIRHADPKFGHELTMAHLQMVERALEMILQQSTLNVRILTRSLLARRHFEVFKRFRQRLLFGMSLPTLNDRLARVYEPHAPAPARRLETLKAAKAAGLHVYVAVAPTYPECDEADLRATLAAVADLDPVTVFHEPINIRAENVGRIHQHAQRIGVPVNTDVFAPPEAWRKYAIGQLRLVERLAGEAGIGERLHLWPDASLISNVALSTYKNALDIYEWILRCHRRISKWPKA